MAFDGSEQTNVFDTEFLDTVKNKMIQIRFKESNLCQPLFPDFNAKIIGNDNDKSFCLKMFDNETLKIAPNSEEFPYFIDFIVPGIYLFSNSV